MEYGYVTECFCTYQTAEKDVISPTYIASVKPVVTAISHSLARDNNNYNISTIYKKGV